jgi:hypothetical protein
MNFEPSTALKMRELRDEFRTFFVSEYQSSNQFEDVQELVVQIQM